MHHLTIKSSKNLPFSFKKKKKRGCLATSKILPAKCFVFLHLSCQDLAKLLECKRNCMLKQQQENQNGGVNQQGLDGENVLVLQEAEKFGCSSLFITRKKPSFIVFFQLRYSLKTSTCKFVNLSIISHALPEGSAPVPFHPRGTPRDSSTIEEQDYFPSESLYVWKRKGEFC